MGLFPSISRIVYLVLGAEGRTSLTDLLHEYNHFFQVPWDPVTSRTQMVQHEIETIGA